MDDSVMLRIRNKEPGATKGRCQWSEIEQSELQVKAREASTLRRLSCVIGWGSLVPTGGRRLRYLEVKRQRWATNAYPDAYGGAKRHVLLCAGHWCPPKGRGRGLGFVHWKPSNRGRRRGRG